jgi:hypothetical protein
VRDRSGGFQVREADAVDGSNAQIPLKNSNFCVDHSSEDRWQLQWKIP